MTEQEYNDNVDMFATEGWKQFIAVNSDLEEAITKGAVDNAQTNDQWQFMRGALTQLRNVLGYEQYVKLSYENQQELDKSL